MDYSQIQEDMFKTMFRFRKMNMGRIIDPVSPSEYKMLDILAGCPGNERTDKKFLITQLAVISKVSVPAVSRLLKTMEIKGYICRMLDERDHRSTWVGITEKGRAVCEECRKALNAFAEKVIRRMDQDQVQQLIELLNDMFDIMSDELNQLEGCETESC